MARALVNRPSILLADEPTGNLDSRTSVEIMEIFQDLNDKGLTIVLVTHEHDIAQFARRVLIFKDGTNSKGRADAESAQGRGSSEDAADARRLAVLKPVTPKSLCDRPLGIMGGQLRIWWELEKAKIPNFPPACPQLRRSKF